MQSDVKRPRQIGLPVALAISVLLHLLLVLVTVWAPLSGNRAAAVEPVDDMLRFTFAPETEQDVEGRLEGEIPPTMPDARDQPQPFPEPEIAPPVPPQMDPPPPQPPPAQNAAEPVETERPPVERPAAEQVPSPLPERPEGAFIPAPEDARPAEPGRQVEPSEADRLNVTRALSNFKRLIDRARESAPPPESSSSSSSNVFVPDPTALPGTGFGVGNLHFESGDYDWTDYSRQIYIAIWRAWHNRLYETTDDFEKWAHRWSQPMLNHSSGVRFTIQRSGQVTGIALEAESGCPPLDASAVDALAEVILPPLPDDFPRDQETIHARFLAIGEILGLRPTLRRAKQLGYF